MAFYGNKFRSLLNSLLTAENQTKVGKRLGAKFTITCDPKLVHELHTSDKYIRSSITRRMVSHFGADQFAVAQDLERSTVKRKELKPLLNNRMYKRIVDDVIPRLDSALSQCKGRVDIYRVIRNTIQVSFLEEYLGVNYDGQAVQSTLRTVGFNKHEGNDESFEKLFIMNFVQLPMWLRNIFSPSLKSKNKSFKKVTELIYDNATVKPDSWMAKLKELEQAGTITRREALGEIRGVLINADTIAVSLVWTMYRLTVENERHREQAKQSLIYARYCFMEGLRLHPPFNLMGYEKVSKCPFHRNETYIVSATATHRNPLYWNNPNSFEPLRFEKGMKDIEKGAYIPFGGGERVCPGIAMSMNVAPAIITHLFNNYKLLNVEVPKTTELQMVESFAEITSNKTNK